jgi:endonuclease/exonuclease/phosphatase (EEP) superfamily protein YafD
MDEIQRLGELLSANQRNEEHKHQQFHADLAQWEASIRTLYEQIEQWLAPLVTTGQIVTEYEPHLAQSKGYPDENSPFRTQRLTLSIAGRQVVLIPDAMGPKGAISVVATGLSLHGQEQVLLTCVAATQGVQWMETKRIGVKESDAQPFTADYFAKQLQALVPSHSV